MSVEPTLVTYQPWTRLKIPKRIDKALESLFNKILEKYVYNLWYNDLSKNEAFVDELRVIMRHITAAVLRRSQKIDIPSLILQKLLKTTLQHLHFYLNARKLYNSDVDEDIQQFVLKKYRPCCLHKAMYTRKAESEYLRKILDGIFPLVLPNKSLHCRPIYTLAREILAGLILLPLMDVLANPDFLNFLLLTFLSSDTNTDNGNIRPEMTPILQNFSKPRNTKKSSLSLQLKEIREDQEIFYLFMQFMKKEAAVNFLQFYTLADNLNENLIRPDLKVEDLQCIHDDVRQLFESFMQRDVLGSIPFDEEIIEEFREIANGPPEDVIKLQTTTAYFRAYEYTITILEKEFLPKFHHSDEYFQLLCGERLKKPDSLSSSRNNSKAKAENAGLSKISNRLKGVFRTTNVMDGKPLDDLIDYGGEEADPIMGIEDRLDGTEFSDQVMEATSPLHDLSNWRVCIVDILEKYDQEKKPFWTFVLELRRIDRLDFPCTDKEMCDPPMWKVERRYHEFYVLESRLQEFHGDNIPPNLNLPPKKTFGTSRKDFLASKKKEFEEYLQNLLTLPVLKGSELLHTFLKSNSKFTSSILPDINDVGKLVRTKAMKLVKEKGQHLESFLHSFVSSTEAGKPKPSRNNDSDSDAVSISSEKMVNSIYENNAESASLTSFETSFSSLQPHMKQKHDKCLAPSINSVFDAIFYLAKYLFGVSQAILQFFVVARMFLKNTFDNLMDYKLGEKLDYVFHENQLSKLIKMLEDTLFNENNFPRSEEEKKERCKKTLCELQDSIPKIFSIGIGKDKIKKDTKILFELFQQPKLNKQLSYLLLDDVITELFPELKEENDC
ncbi:DgyrCDS3447 [Dimorphilus gyrociliatus]|uniref:DgyrCDS3447 n=1 Tax=Dimorphilus gyrociliatus TaxID=2664684 RepID=A0A7I8VDQ0_9ANNE|nr:DgyrCDS3447 [Dimorphilus gyrociliatus]